jgi:hypothetical protein
MLALMPARLGPTATPAIANFIDPPRTAVQMQRTSMAALRLFAAHLHKGFDAFASDLSQPNPLRIVDDLGRVIGEHILDEIKLPACIGSATSRRGRDRKRAH